MDKQTISTDRDDAFTPAERDYLLRRIGELGYPSQQAAGLAAGIKQSAFSKLLHGMRPAKRVYRKTLLAVLGPSAAPAAVAANMPRVVDMPNNGVSSLPGSSLEESAVDKGTGRGARASSPVGALRPRLHWIYRWGLRSDLQRLGGGTRGTHEGRLLVLGHESDIIGEDGFGVEVDNVTLANWEVGLDQTIRPGWVVWCDPAGREHIVEGHLVVVSDPALGLRAGVYREDADGPYIETDDPRLAEQERQRIRHEWIAGPVVYASTGGMPHRRAQQHGGERAEPVG